ncbi:MAG: ABC transporter permease subunit [Burkholderiales bacterium]|nr:ABC transporter permease subunit [Burkholderiales bacterium]
MQSSFHSKWFWGYTLCLLIGIGSIFASGISDSRVSGFTGLTRLLLIFIQACNLILPIFILVSTVRTLVKEKENSIFEYLLSFPISLKEYFFAKFLSRFIILSVPLLGSMCAAVLLCILKGQKVPYEVIFLYTGLLMVSTFFYVSLSFLISSIVKSQEAGLGLSLFIWLVFIALLDIALLGLMIKALLPENLIYAIALCNPTQVFKIAAISLFDPVLSVVGPVSFFILDTLGSIPFLVYAFCYFSILGTGMVFSAFYFFSRKDLL